MSIPNHVVLIRSIVIPNWVCKNLIDVREIHNAHVYFVTYQQKVLAHFVVTIHNILIQRYCIIMLGQFPVL
jgi:hypothetical protein